MSASITPTGKDVATLRAERDTLAAERDVLRCEKEAGDRATAAAALPDDACCSLVDLCESARGGLLPIVSIDYLEQALGIVRDVPSAQHEVRALELIREGTRLLQESPIYQRGEAVSEARNDEREAARKEAERNAEFRMPMSLRQAFLRAYDHAKAEAFPDALARFAELRALVGGTEPMSDYISALNTIQNGASWLEALVAKMRASVQPNAGETRITFNRSARRKFCALLGLPETADVEEIAAKLAEAEPAHAAAA